MCRAVRNTSVSVSAVLAVVLGAAQLRAEGFRFLIPEAEAFPGQQIELTVEGDYAVSVQGFSLAFSYPVDALEIVNIDFTQTILGAIGADFLVSEVDREQGHVFLAALVDVKPPFESELIPAIGQPLALARMLVEVSSDASEDIQLEFRDGLFQPPVQNLFVVDDVSVPVDELGGGSITLLRKTMFIRGDANSDVLVDIADPIAVLNYQFSYGFEPPSCLVACDVNLDDWVDISDAIYLLRFLFEPSMPPPPHPFPAPGSLDYFSRLDCKQGLDL